MLAEAKAAAYGSPSAENLRKRYVSNDLAVRNLLADGVAEPMSAGRKIMSSLTFKEIRFDKLDAVVALTVGPHQASLVADNAYSIAQALLDSPGRLDFDYSP